LAGGSTLVRKHAVLLTPSGGEYQNSPCLFVNFPLKRIFKLGECGFQLPLQMSALAGLQETAAGG
jgi:hypothetical protein